MPWPLAMCALYFYVLEARLEERQQMTADDDGMAQPPVRFSDSFEGWMATWCSL